MNQEMVDRMRAQMEGMEAAREQAGATRWGVEALSAEEREMVNMVFPDAKGFSVVRRSDRAFDVNVTGVDVWDSVTRPGTKMDVRFSAWLPLAAVRNLTRWTSWPVARMTDFPEMAMEGDWSGVRDTSEEKLWAMFDRFCKGVKVFRVVK